MEGGIWEEIVASATVDGSLPRRVIPLIAIDLVMVIATSVLIGATAPRWPSRWLQRDRFLLTFLPWESPAYFRALRVSRWAARLPELGSAFGGQRKDELMGISPNALASYLVEVRRAEWVHWGSVLATLVLFAFNPWWLALAFVIAVSLGNAPFLLVLRNNRLRIERILTREARRA